MIIEFKKKKLSFQTNFLLKHAKTLSLLLPCAALICFFFFDKPFALFLYSRTNLQEPLSSINKLFSPLFSLLLFPTLFFFYKFMIKQEKKSRKLLFLSLVLPISILCTQILQIACGRPTPQWLFLHGETAFRPLQWNPFFHSFPSVISCTLGALGTSFAYLYPKSSSFFLLGSFFLALSPSLATLCFLSDALMGFYLGAIFSFLIFKKMKTEMSFYS